MSLFHSCTSLTVSKYMLFLEEPSWQHVSETVHFGGKGFSTSNSLASGRLLDREARNRRVALGFISRRFPDWRKVLSIIKRFFSFTFEVLSPVQSSHLVRALKEQSVSIILWILEAFKVQSKYLHAAAGWCRTLSSEQRVCFWCAQHLLFTPETDTSSYKTTPPLIIHVRIDKKRSRK